MVLKKEWNEKTEIHGEELREVEKNRKPYDISQYIDVAIITVIVKLILFTLSDSEGPL